MNRVADDDVIAILANLRIVGMALAKLANDQSLVIDRGKETIGGGGVISRSALEMKCLALEVIQDCAVSLDPSRIPDDISEAADEIMLDKLPVARYGWNNA